MTNSRAGQNSTFVVKQADQTVNSSETLVNDSELLLTVKSNKEYAFELILKVNSGTTPDFKCLSTLPSGATVVHANAVLTGANPMSTTDFLAERTFSTSGSDELIIIIGVIIVSTTGGIFQFKWAQNTSDAGATKVLAGSILKLWTT